MERTGMIRVGITGQAGFVGTHLYHLMGTQPEVYERIPFEDAFFQDPAALRSFVKQCDVIVHLAAMNRHPDPQVIYETNLQLTQQLIDAMVAEGVTPQVLFASSTQEERDNLYGASKREGRERLATWAQTHGAAFVGCVIPNIFGPFGRPNYNSVVATFCHLLTHDGSPEIQVDGEIPLLYVGDLCGVFLDLIRRGVNDPCFRVPYQRVMKVSELLETLTSYRDLYLNQGVIPYLPTPFEVRLFNTFCGYIDHAKVYPMALKANTDARGSFVETMRLDRIGGQVSFSTTHPGVTRGNHYHTRKIERFAVIKGKALIELRRIGTNEVLSFEVDGAQPAFVDMPVWYTHNITNIGDDDLYTLFWINEFYNPEDPDTFFESVK
jgi:UDP-2-acetamido-2,6-beta-L-arabino-hexul-4-ose reductase